MSAPRILGCDPGLSGALALLVGDEIKVWDSPVVASEIDPDELTRFIRDAQPDFAVVERVASMPGNGAASMFSFGKSYGMLRGVVAACGVPYHLVPPTVWKKHFKLTIIKEESRGLAIRLWPGCGLFNLKKHSDRAEAALIARYGQEVIASVRGVRP